MYKATGDETYLTKATSMYDEFEMKFPRKIVANFHGVAMYQKSV